MPTFLRPKTDSNLHDMTSNPDIVAAAAGLRCVFMCITITHALTYPTLPYANVRARGSRCRFRLPHHLVSSFEIVTQMASALNQTHSRDVSRNLGEK